MNEIAYQGKELNMEGMINVRQPSIHDYAVIMP